MLATVALADPLVIRRLSVHPAIEANTSSVRTPITRRSNAASSRRIIASPSSESMRSVRQQEIRVCLRLASG
jgi:hypothetical protein